MRKVDTTEYLNMVCGLLAEGKSSVPVPVAGSSMAPFLHHGDTVYLEKAAPPLRKGDIVLYTRPTGQYVLHRIVRVNGDGSFIMMGDAQTEPERIESAAQIHGRVASILHKGELLTPQSPRWRFFGTVWIGVRPWRQTIVKTVTKLKNKTR